MSDLIDRQAAIDVLEERLKANGYSNVALVSEFNRSIGYLRQLPAVQRCSDCENLSKTQLLIPQPERKKGKWIETDSHEPCWYKCDQCGRLHDFLDNFCPNCGADMRGEGHE